MLKHHYLHMTCSSIKKLSEIYIKATKINDTKIGEKRRNSKKNQRSIHVAACIHVYNKPPIFKIYSPVYEHSGCS